MSPGSWLDAGSGVHTTPAESDLLFHRICGPSLRGRRAEAAPAPLPGSQPGCASAKAACPGVTWASAVLMTFPR